MDFLIMDDTGVIESFNSEDDAWATFRDYPASGAVYSGDLKLVQVLGVSR